MKNKDDVQKEIQRLLAESMNRNTDSKTIKANKKRIEELKVVKMYLDTNPTEQSLRGQLEKLTTTVETLLNRFDEWKRSSFEARQQKNPLTYYSTINDIPRMNDQIDTLKYILS